MELERICISLETAKKLKEKGIVIDSVLKYYHIYDLLYGIPRHSTWSIGTDNDIGAVKWIASRSVDLIYPAPTAEEIDIPDHIEIQSSIYLLEIKLAINHWMVNYYNPGGEKSLIDYDKLCPYPDAHKLCEVMASVLIFLKENSYL